MHELSMSQLVTGGRDRGSETYTIDMAQRKQ